MSTNSYDSGSDQHFEDYEKVEEKTDYILEPEEDQDNNGGVLNAVNDALSEAGSSIRDRSYEAIIAGGAAFTAYHSEELMDVTGETAAQAATPEGQASAAILGGGVATAYAVSSYFEDITNVSDVQ